MSEFRLGARPSLDGVRGLGIAMVMLFHSLTYLADWYGSYGNRFLKGANSAVDVFFALSGFLITVLLLEEYAANGRISFKRFYTRRALRLFPVLYAAVALFAVWLFVARPDGASQFGGAALRITTWTANFFIGDDLFLTQWFGQTWSLAIEEQFYVIWPVTLLALIRLSGEQARRVVVAVLLVATVGFGVWRASLFSDTQLWSEVYYRTDARFDQILVGCLLGALLHYGWVRERARPWLAVIGLAIWLVVAQTVSPFDSTYYSIGAPATNVAAFALILGVMTGTGPVARLLGQRPLRWLGRMSYTLYIVHVPVYNAFATGLAGQGWLAKLLLANVTTFAIVVALHVAVEAPALRLKGRFSALSGRASPAPRGPIVTGEAPVVGGAAPVVAGEGPIATGEVTG